MLTTVYLNGKKIKKLREGRGWGVNDLANALDIPASFIAKIENNTDSVPFTLPNIVVKSLRNWMEIEEEKKKTANYEDTKERFAKFFSDTLKKNESEKEKEFDLLDVVAKIEPKDTLTFGDVLRRIRLIHGITTSEMAKRIDVASSCISSWETNLFVPAPSNMKKIAVLFGINAEKLYEFIPNERLRRHRKMNCGHPAEGEMLSKKMVVRLTKKQEKVIEKIATAKKITLQEAVRQIINEKINRKGVDLT